MLEPQAGSPHPTGEVTGWAALGATRGLKTSISETRASRGLICVGFLLKYLVAGCKGVCCSREKSI